MLRAKIEKGKGCVGSSDRYKSNKKNKRVKYKKCMQIDLQEF